MPLPRVAELSRLVFNRFGLSDRRSDFAFDDDAVPAWIDESVRSAIEQAPAYSETGRRLEEAYLGAEAATRNSNLLLVRFRGGVPSFEGRQTHRGEAVCAGFQAVAAVAAIPDTSLLVSLRDGMHSIRTTEPRFASLSDPQLPLLTFARRAGEGRFLSIPDYSCFATGVTAYSWLSRLAPRVDNLNGRIPWHEKAPRACWRGTLNRSVRQSMSPDSAIRLELCEISNRRRDVLDARWTVVSDTARKQIPPAVLSRYRAPFEIGLKGHFRFRYQVAIDGNTCPFPGLHWKLYSDMCVIRQVTSDEQWYYHRLEPWRHFVPSKPDLSDLIEHIERLRDDDELARAIAAEGRRFAEEHLTARPVIAYLVRLTQAYAQRYGDG